LVCADFFQAFIQFAGVIQHAADAVVVVLAPLAMQITTDTTADSVGGFEQVALHHAALFEADSIRARMSRFRQQVTPAESFTGAGALPDLTHAQKVDRDIGSRLRTCGRRISVSSVCIASAPFGFDALHGRDYGFASLGNKCGQIILMV
jgi:hypothetical protein